jgi:uncharacterized protein (TIGR03503 family)
MMISLSLRRLTSLQIYTCLLLNLTLAANTSAQAPEAAKPSDVRIVIDISGSMKKNDPQNLRRPALDMLTKLMPEGSKAGVWTFGQYVNMLVKHRPVDNAWKQEVTSQQSSINSIAQFTNIGEALEKAAYDKHYSTKGQFQTHVVLLTDGMVDIDRDPAVNAKERSRILDKILPMYQDAGYTLHTISLSDKADKKLMDRLALATNGQSAVAKSADELMNVFLQVFDQAVPSEELPLEGNRFATDSSIEEFTALIFRQPGTEDAVLIGPDQSEYSKTTNDSNVNWYHTEKYDLITVKRPLEGEWRIIAKLEPQSRVTVVSDLSLVVKPLPVNVLANEKIDLSLALREENKVITRAEFLDLLDIDVTVNQLESSVNWNNRLSDGLVPGNGIYKTELDYFKKTGQYAIAVDVDGKSFKRRFTHRTNVREPFAVEATLENSGGQSQYKVQVIPQVKSIDFENTQVVGKLKDPSGSSTIKNFGLNNEQVWQLTITPELEGTYYLTLRITTKDDNGEVNNIIPKPLSFQYPQADTAFDSLVDPEPIVEAEPVIEEPAVEEPVAEETPEVEPAIDEEDELETEKDMTQWILYGVLAVVNILIILVIYLLYRKLFGRKSVVDEEETEGDAPAANMDAGSPTESPAAFEEPPMDEMVVDELDDDIDLAEEDSAEKDVDLGEEDPFDGLSPESLDDDSSEDEDPEFSLDDFAPDALDDDEESK